MVKCPECGVENPDNLSICRECGYELSVGTTGLLQADTILEGRYLISRTLGRGGMGAVYLAFDQRLNNSLVAIKEMSTRIVGTGDLAGAVAAFKQEASILIKLKHPALPRIIDFFPQDERWFFVMDYIEGETLQQIAARRGPISEHELLDWGRQIGEILAYLHSQTPPIIFRDLKPSNIMLTPQGEIKLIDFGIARHFQTGRTVDTTAYGSHGFAPPEQYGQQQTDPRADMYSLGATLHCLLTGRDPQRRPFSFVPPGQLVQVSPQTERAIMKCLEIKVEDRPESVQQLMNMLPLSVPGSFPAQGFEMLTDSSPTAPLPAEDLARIRTDQDGEADQAGSLPSHSDRQVYGSAEDSMARKKLGSKTRLAILGLIAILLLGGYGVFYSVNHKEMERRAQFDLYMQAGAEAFKQKDYLQAEEEYQQALALYPESQAHTNLARTYLSSGQNEKVIKFLIDLINKGQLDNSVEVKYLLGTAYFSLFDYNKAVFYFEQAVQEGADAPGKDNEDAYRDLAVCYARSGDHEKAQAILDDIIHNSGINKHIANYVSGELGLIKQDYTAARKEFETAVQLDPNNTRYKVSLAQLYVANNQQALPTSEKISNYLRAIDLLKAVHKEDRFNVIALNELGQACYDVGLLYESQGDSTGQAMFQEGLLSFNKLLDMGLEDVELLINIGILQEKLANLAEAEKTYLQALQLDNNSSRANLVYGLFKLKQKQYSESYPYLHKTVQLNEIPAEAAIAQEKIDELRAKGWI